MGVLDGQPVDAAVTNPAFINKNIDDITPSKLGFANTDPVSGTSITNAQMQLNSLCSFLGENSNLPYNQVPVWTNNYIGLQGDPVKNRVDEITGQFAASGTGIPLLGILQLGVGVAVSASSSSDVSSQFSGFTPSTGATEAGVVVTAPNNKCVIRDSTNDDVIVDSTGNIVYGRLTHSGSVWTLSYYSEINGVETAYTFTTASLTFYYQILCNPIGGLLDPYTQDQFIQPSRELHSIAINGGSLLYGNVTLLAGSGGIGLAQSGQNITIYSTDVTSLKASGFSSLIGDIQIAAGSRIGVTQSGQIITIAASGNVWSIAASGSTQLTGDVVVAASGGAVVTQSGQTITVFAPASSSGVSSLAASGSSALTGAVVLAASGGTVLSESGQTITIFSPTSSGSLQQTVFTASGTFTKPASLTATTLAKVTVIGAGGGGASGGGATKGGGSGGGGGGTAIRYVLGASIGGTETVTVGTGSTGSTGGTSSFGALATATGGVGGSNSGGNAGSGGGAGGVGSSGDMNLQGQGGGPSERGDGSTFSGGGGMGGSSFMGGGAPATGSGNNTNGTNGGNYGGGGSGGAGSGSNSTGANGLVLVEWVG